MHRPVKFISLKLKTGPIPIQAHALNASLSKVQAMSKSAVIFLLASLVSFAGTLLLPAPAASHSTALGIACGIFTLMFVAALFVGRRIKFDPLLR